MIPARTSMLKLLKVGESMIVGSTSSDCLKRASEIGIKITTDKFILIKTKEASGSKVTQITRLE